MDSQTSLTPSGRRSVGIKTDAQRAHDAACQALFETDFNEKNALRAFKRTMDLGMQDYIVTFYLMRVAEELTDFDGAEEMVQRARGDESQDAAPEDREYRETGAKKAPKVAPQPAKRGAEAIASVQKTMKKTLLDTYKVLDGRILGDITYGELGSLAAKSVKDGALLKMLRDRVSNTDPATKVRDIVKPKDLERMVKDAERIAGDTINDA